MVHRRFLFPVGQGGFSVERIGNFTVIYDCGSYTSLGIVENCIDALSGRIDQIDVLFISHFDNDHVNSIRYLLHKMKVKRAITSMIPNVLKVAYNIYTDGAYNTIISLLRENEVEIDSEVSSEGRRFMAPESNTWEWIAKSMIREDEFGEIINRLVCKGLDEKKLDDADYLNKEKKKVNDAFKDTFGAKGPNAKGLIVLSQKAKKVKTDHCYLYSGCFYWRHFGLYYGHSPIGEHKESSCLYVGDADLKNRVNKEDVKVFIKRYKTEDILLLMQIPHHGSPTNRGVDFETDFPARYYFVNDVNTKRLEKAPDLFRPLNKQNKLLVVSDRIRDMIVGETEIV